MTQDMAARIEEANTKLKGVGEAFNRYRTALGEAASAFESLASACEAVISQPYIEVDTRDIDG